MGARDAFIESRKNCAVLFSQFEKMAVRQFARRTRKRRKPINSNLVFEYLNGERHGCLESCQRLSRRGNIKLQGGVNCDPDKPKFGYGACAQAGPGFSNRTVPFRGAVMVDMRRVSESGQCVHVEKVLHGKSTRAART
jgi:hypothetical protein